MADLNALFSLAERLEKATGPGRELDALLLQAFPTGWMRSRCQSFEIGKGGWLESQDYKVKSDAYTASLDAALALVERMLPGWFVWALCDYRTRIIYKGDKHQHKDWKCELQHENGGRLEGKHAPTPALAILRALVAALIAKEEGHA